MLCFRREIFFSSLAFFYELSVRTYTPNDIERIVINPLNTNHLAEIVFASIWTWTVCVSFRIMFAIIDVYKNNKRALCYYCCRYYYGVEVSSAPLAATSPPKIAKSFLRQKLFRRIHFFYGPTKLSYNNNNNNNSRNVNMMYVIAMRVFAYVRSAAILNTNRVV